MPSEERSTETIEDQIENFIFLSFPEALFGRALFNESKTCNGFFEDDFDFVVIPNSDETVRSEVRIHMKKGAINEAPDSVIKWTGDDTIANIGKRSFSFDDDNNFLILCVDQLPHEIVVGSEDHFEAIGDDLFSIGRTAKKQLRKSDKQRRQSLKQEAAKERRRSFNERRRSFTERRPSFNNISRRKSFSEDKVLNDGSMNDSSEKRRKSFSTLFSKKQENGSEKRLSFNMLLRRGSGHRHSFRDTGDEKRRSLEGGPSMKRLSVNTLMELEKLALEEDEE